MGGTVACAAVTLDEVQALMEDLFGEADRERGIPATVAWLCEELGELAQAVRKGSPDQQLHELGDVVAWTASLANQLGLRLDDAMARYRRWPDEAAGGGDPVSPVSPV
jgi:NTP pyrophosphatase (non-canonical NTP hydrolase)